MHPLIAEKFFRQEINCVSVEMKSGIHSLERTGEGQHRRKLFLKSTNCAFIIIAQTQVLRHDGRQAEELAE